MRVHGQKLNAIEGECRTAEALQDYAAVNGLWVCLVKLANLLPGAENEHEQIASLLRDLSRAEATTVTSNQGVDQLLGLEPPLESIIGDPRERLAQQRTATRLEILRGRRTSDPKAALAALFEILQRVRDKREHGFKTPRGPRDAEILEATKVILGGMCAVVIGHLRVAS